MPCLFHPFILPCIAFFCFKFKLSYLFLPSALLCLPFPFFVLLFHTSPSLHLTLAMYYIRSNSSFPALLLPYIFPISYFPTFHSLLTSPYRYFDLPCHYPTLPCIYLAMSSPALPLFYLVFTLPYVFHALSLPYLTLVIPLSCFAFTVHLPYPVFALPYLAYAMPCIAFIQPFRYYVFVLPFFLPLLWNTQHFLCLAFTLAYLFLPCLCLALPLCYLCRSLLLSFHIFSLPYH